MGRWWKRWCFLWFRCFGRRRWVELAAPVSVYQGAVELEAVNVWNEREG